jgi:hypothetical protein
MLQKELGSSKVAHPLLHMTRLLVPTDPWNVRTRGARRRLLVGLVTRKGGRAAGRAGD